MKIMIATDGSKFSQAAIKECAAHFVNPETDEIKIISVYEKLGPLVGEPFGMSAIYYTQVEDAGKDLADQSVADASVTLASCFPGKQLNISTVVDKGREASVIVETADSWGAELIVVGSHGRGFWERNLLGSVSDSVVHHAHCSVLVVRPAAE
jgi:nucleotide-binding universal stress UspA family protein